MISTKVLPVVVTLFMLSACTSFMAGGGAQVGKAEREPGVVASDAAVTTRIKSKYAADSVVSVFEIGVRTWAGTVTLTGTVGSYRARDRAADIAKDTSGVRAVNNLIELEDRSTEN